MFKVLLGSISKALQGHGPTQEWDGYSWFFLFLYKIATFLYSIYFCVNGGGAVYLKFSGRHHGLGL